MNIQENISVDDWFAFLDGMADAGTRRRIETAIATNAATQAVHEALRISDTLLREEALELHRKLQLSPQVVEAACQEVLRRVSAPVFSRARLQRCEEVLQPWCGRRVAASLILAAVARTRADNPEALWPAFLAHAESLASVLCGVAAARLFAEVSGSML